MSCWMHVTGGFGIDGINFDIDPVHIKKAIETILTSLPEGSEGPLDYEIRIKEPIENGMAAIYYCSHDGDDLTIWRKITPHPDGEIL